MLNDYLRVRHRDCHDGRKFIVWQTLTKPHRFVATWDQIGEDNVPAESEYRHRSFCVAIDSLIAGASHPQSKQVAEFRPAVISPPPANKQLDLF